MLLEAINSISFGCALLIGVTLSILIFIIVMEEFGCL